MSNLTDIEKELQQAAASFLLASQLAGTVDPESAAKLDEAIRRLADALFGQSVVPRSIVGKLMSIPAGLLKLAQLPDDPPAMRAAAQRYLETICEIFPDTPEQG